GDLGTARARFLESLALRRELGNRRGIAECLEGLARVTAAQDQPERAAILFGAAHALRDHLAAPLPVNERPDQEEQLDALRRGLGAERFGAAWETGHALPWEKAAAAAERTGDE